MSKLTKARELLRLKKDMNNLWVDPKYTDLNVRCNGLEWRVHRAVVCTRSDFFDKVCTDPFQESQLGVITLNDDSPAIIHCLLMYLYTSTVSADDMQEIVSKKPGPVPTLLLLWVRLYSAADKYNLPGLKAVARDNFEKDMLEVNLWEESETIEEVYSSTSANDRGLRDICLNIIMSCSRNSSEKTTAWLQSMLTTTPSCATDIATALLYSRRAEL